MFIDTTRTWTSSMKLLLLAVLLLVVIFFSFMGRGPMISPSEQRIQVQNTGKSTVMRGGISPPTNVPPLKLNSTNSQKIDVKQPKELLLWRPKLSKTTKVIFLRVPKTGSRTLASLIEAQVIKKGFRYWDFATSVDGTIRKEIIDRHRGKCVYAAHMRYVDFHWEEPPIYISLVRDPIARITSNYYFSMHGDFGNGTSNYVQQKREEMTRNTGDMVIPTLNECILRDISFCTQYHRLFAILFLFCGEDPRCRQPTNWTYTQAVKHIDASLAVGLSEEFDDYLRVLEKLMPSLFQGILKAYLQPQSSAAQRTKASKTKFKEPLSAEAESKLLKTLELEYRIYNYARDRFHGIKRQLGIV